MSTIQTRDRTETETAASKNAETVAALGKTVIHVGGRPATEKLFELGRFDSDQHVLDAGCGVGTTAIQLASHYGSRVTAIDISPPLVGRATVNVQAAGLEDRITVQQGDILNLEFPMTRSTGSSLKRFLCSSIVIRRRESSSGFASLEGT